MDYHDKMALALRLLYYATRSLTINPANLGVGEAAEDLIVNKIQEPPEPNL